MNENQENNLNSVTPEVSNTEPVEPVVTPTPAPVEEPTPVESPAPVAEPTPVESQAPVAELTPTPVETPSPVAAPTPVETPAPVAEPIPVQPVQSVVEPAPNVAPVVNSAPVSEPVIAAKKSNPVVVVLLILVLIGVCGYGLYKYTDIFKPKTKNGGTTVTTTTTSAVNSNLAFKSFEDFVSVAKAECIKDGYCGEDLLLNLDKTFTKIEPDMNNKCTEEGKSVSFELNNNKIEYVCKKDTSEIALDELYNDKIYWYSEVTLNNTFKYNYGTFTTSIPGELHSNGKYYIDFDNSQGVDVDHMVIYDSNQKELYKNYNVVSDVKFNKGDENYTDIASLTKDNILYFVDVDDEPTRDVSTTCNLKYIDFNKSEIKVEKTGFTSICFVE